MTAGRTNRIELGSVARLADTRFIFCQVSLKASCYVTSKRTIVPSFLTLSSIILAVNMVRNEDFQNISEHFKELLLRGRVIL